MYLARDNITNREYALKIYDKQHVMRNGVVDRVLNERDVLSRLKLEGIVGLHFTAQDADSLYIGLEYCAGGELFEQIHRKRRLDLATTRFYTAELVLILEGLRTEGIVHRDLKPENILLTASGHLVLADFGSAGKAGMETEESSAFVGSADYVAPEVLRKSQRAFGFALDLWALGCIIYQMLSGRPPFRAPSEYLIFQNVLAGTYKELDPDVGLVAQDLVKCLLHSDPMLRLGARNFLEIKEHPFFEGVDWNQIRNSVAPECISESLDMEEEDGEEEDWELLSLRERLKDSPLNYLSNAIPR